MLKKLINKINLDQKVDLHKIMRSLLKICGVNLIQHIAHTVLKLQLLKLIQFFQDMLNMILNNFFLLLQMAFMKI
jgi:hypothetical protein